MTSGMNKYFLELLERCIPCIESEYETTGDESREDALLSLLQSVRYVVKESKQTNAVDE